MLFMRVRLNQFEGVTGIEKFNDYFVLLTKNNFLRKYYLYNSIVLVLNEDAYIRVSKEDSGVDVSNSKEINYFGENVLEIKTGCKIYIPLGFTCFVYPRSSSFKYGYAFYNSVGVIDSSYRGEIHFILEIKDYNKFKEKLLTKKETNVLKKNTILGHLIIIPTTYPSNHTFIEHLSHKPIEIDFLVVRSQKIFDTFSEIFPSDRKENGFGSTGI